MQESHGPDASPAEILEVFDVFGSVFQTHLPEQVGELISGKITTQQFAKETTHEVRARLMLIVAALLTVLLFMCEMQCTVYSKS